MAGTRPWGFRLDTGGVAAFHMVMQGEARVEISSKEVLTLGPGDVLMIPELPHTVTDMEGGSPVLHDLNSEFNGHRIDPLMLGQGGIDTLLLSGRCCFDAELGKPLLAALPSHVIIRGIDKNPPEWLRIGLEFLGQEVQQRRPGRDVIINRLIDILFVECLRDYVESLPEGSGSWLLALRDAALSAALSAIHSRPEYPWTVPELASVACLSRSAFAERFSDVMGQPPLSYLQAHRMRIAAWQLRHTQQPVCRIAELVGYASETAFSQAFKRQYGNTPSRFRNEGEAAVRTA